MNKVNSISIRSKIVISLVGLCLLSLLIVSLITGSKIHSTLKDQAKAQLVQAVSQKSDEYNLIFKRIAEETQSVAMFASDTIQRKEILTDLGTPVLMPWKNQGSGYGFNKGYGSTESDRELILKTPKLQRIGKVLESISAKNNLITLAYFTSVDGIIIADKSKAIEEIGKSEGWIPANRPWHKAAVANKGTTWTEPYVDVNTKNLVVTVATPTYDDNGTLLGVVGFDVLLQTIKDDILKMNIGYDGYSLLVGNKGQALISPDTGDKSGNWSEKYETENLLQTSNPSLNSIISDMTEQKTGIGIYKDEHKGINYLAYAPIDGINASVGLVVSEKIITAPALNILKWIGLVAAITALCAILTGITLGNSISKPITKLTDLANDISNGKAKLETLPIERKDELGSLTNAFNRLISSLRIAMKMKDDV